MEVLNVIVDICGWLFIVGVVRAVGMLAMGYKPKQRWDEK